MLGRGLEKEDKYKGKRDTRKRVSLQKPWPTEFLRPYVMSF